MGWSLNHLLHCDVESELFLLRIVAGDDRGAPTLSRVAKQPVCSVNIPDHKRAKQFKSQFFAGNGLPT